MLDNNLLFLDVETQSEVDLKVRGADVYVRHPSTQVMALGFSFGEEEPQVSPAFKKPPQRVIDHISKGGTVVCHNAFFEVGVWNYTLRRIWPDLPSLNIEQMTCTMAEAYAMSLPGSLDNASSAVGLHHKKDMAGNRIMLKLCKPREVKDDGSVIWYTEKDSPYLYQEMYKYCAQDIRVHRELFRRLMRLSPREKELWHLDYNINQRGIKIDIDNATKARDVAEAERVRLDKEMRKITKGKVATCTSTAQLVRWLNEEGVEGCDGVAKADVIDMLKLENLPLRCKEALELRQEAAKSSTKKLDAMIFKACDDDRVRSTMQYHGASTGRWAGRGIQVQNFPKSKISQDQIENVFEMLSEADGEDPIGLADAISIFHGSPLSVISACLRGFIVSDESKKLVAADFSNIEGRVLAWLAGEEWKLKAFKAFDVGQGPDLYKLSASRIYNKPIDKITSEERTIGKVSELACGFGGGIGAFQSMAKIYYVKVPDKKADGIKLAWRAANTKIVNYWYELERAAMNAVKYKGKAFKAGAKGREVAYKMKGSFLWCLLPSGRALCYPYPKIEPVKTPWGEMKDAVTFMAVGSPSNKWERQSAYGGFWSENCTQAVARDILVEALFAVEANNYATVMHVHDEIVCEVPESEMAVIDQVMSKSPLWAKDLPIAAEGWISERYQK